MCAFFSALPFPDDNRAQNSSQLFQPGMPRNSVGGGFIEQTTETDK